MSKTLYELEHIEMNTETIDKIPPFKEGEIRFSEDEHIYIFRPVTPNSVNQWIEKVIVAIKTQEWANLLGIGAVDVVRKRWMNLLIN